MSTMNSNVSDSLAKGDRQNLKIRKMTTTALMTAVICILGPLSIPIGPVPISLGNFALLLTMYVLEWKSGVVAYFLYLLIGLIGLPVFSGFGSGPAKLLGPTGGYILGFLPMILITGLFLRKHWQKRILSILIMEIATWVLYVFGTAWLAYSMHLTFAQALATGVIPFIAIDLVKIVIVSLIGPILRKRLAPFSGIQL
ncbi:biotin transporter BioY [Lachnospiraceae bacterium YH-ros2228]